MGAAKPFLKWAGGKTKLLPQLVPLLPDGIATRRHIEPFMGGAAMFFAQRPRVALLSDINADLVNAYRAVRDDVEELLENLRALAKAYSLGPDSHYYAVRESYNKQDMHKDSIVFRAASFIYLNKTCFNGLHRVNKSGAFNVPKGDYKNPDICDEDTLRAAHEALQSAALDCVGYKDVLRKAAPGDFVYFDPPYEPVSATSSFASYAKEGFARYDHVQLRGVVDELDRRGCKVMLSNSDTPFLRAIYTRYNTHLINAARSINSKAEGRGDVSELVVTNY